MVNDNFANGVGQNFTTSFPPGAHLWQYARGSAANSQSLNGFFITLGDGGAGRGSVSANITTPQRRDRPARRLLCVLMEKP